jgi:hypothetical protein
MLNTPRYDRRVRRQAGLLAESLADRLLLSGGAAGATAAAVVHYQPPPDAERDHHKGPREVLKDRSLAELPLDFARALRLLYREYKSSSGDSRLKTSPPIDGLLISGSRVAVVIKVAYPPAMGGYYLSALRADGLRVFRTVRAHGLAEGTLPIARLPAISPLVAHVWPFHEVNPSRHTSK